MICLYWKIGKAILDKQMTDGWDAKVIDRISVDLKEAFPDMAGFSPRNLKYMKKFAECWPDYEKVQQGVAQLPWRTNHMLLDRLSVPETRIWYAKQAIKSKTMASSINTIKSLNIYSFSPKINKLLGEKDGVERKMDNL